MSENLLDAAETTLDNGETDNPESSFRPEGLPDKFWDAENNQIRTEALAKSYQELERKLGSQGVSGVPESPDGYEIEAPHELMESDPEVNACLHEAGLSNEQAQTDGPTGYYGARLDQAVRRYQKRHNLKQDGHRFHALPRSLGRDLIMAYQSKDLSVIAYANGFTLWHYTTIDLATDVDTAGYFNNASDMLRVGDMVMANVDSGGTPGAGIFLVNANAAGAVDVADMTAVGSAYTD